jgi:UDP-glucose 4-epimerase
MMNSDKRIAVLGADGYIGQNLVKYLQDHYSIQADCYGLSDNMSDPNIHYVDVTNKETVSKIDLDVDIIFMLVGLSGTLAGFDSYEKYVAVNEIGLLNLLDAIKESTYRPRVVFPSTRLVYKGVDKALAEGDEKETKTIYAVNKLACEGYLKVYYNSFNIPYTIFRICVPYGNNLSTKYSYGTVGAFLKKASSGSDITLYGDGSQKRTFTHIDDLCYQMVEASMKPESVGGTFNIGGEVLTIREAAQIIADKFGVNVVNVPWPERDLCIESSHTYFDDTKIRQLLGEFSYKHFGDFAENI